jgi:hypothetical protein
MSDPLTNDVDLDDDAERAAERAADKTKDVPSDAKQGAGNVWDKTTDAVERMIPGDSDNDGN